MNKNSAFFYEINKKKFFILRSGILLPAPRVFSNTLVKECGSVWESGRTEEYLNRFGWRQNLAKKKIANFQLHSFSVFFALMAKNRKWITYMEQNWNLLNNFNQEWFQWLCSDSLNVFFNWMFVILNNLNAGKRNYLPFFFVDQRIKLLFWLFDSVLILFSPLVEFATRLLICKFWVF